jgi:hypothetical protein
MRSIVFFGCLGMCVLACATAVEFNDDEIRLNPDLGAADLGAALSPPPGGAGQGGVGNTPARGEGAGGTSLQPANGAAGRPPVNAAGTPPIVGPVGAGGAPVLPVGTAGAAGTSAGAAGAAGAPALVIDPADCDFTNRTGCEALGCESEACPEGGACRDRCQPIDECLTTNVTCITSEDPLCRIRIPGATNGGANLCTLEGDQGNGLPVSVMLELVGCLCRAGRL